MGLFRLGRRRGQDDDFVAYYEARAAALRRTAYILCGDWHLAEDLTQITFTKLYMVWRRLDHDGTLDGYARRTLVRSFLDERRRPWRRETAIVPESPLFDVAVEDPRSADERDQLLSALAQVPNRRRAVLVLRFWEDLSVEQVAEMLGCTSGTVRSQTARGLVDLRAALGDSLTGLSERIG
ncbi:SigE family RNA polymerase sigma factor [Dactylosporangium sp. NPDC049525]|uniref:SigE family RNA polymerase sigma factor n=1 Tax=Dactylosporangium sp. NPDC049525 TaxID=3154730 RepID=UPI0034444E68